MNKSERHVHIPLFIPHEGCGHACVFCDQRTITGCEERADRDIVPEIERALETLGDDAKQAEIAFFGGSFTGIDKSLMERLLADADRYVKRGLVRGIRLSTRPDYIDGEVLSILGKYGVCAIELGIQSASDSVLAACRRGHTAADSEKACALITRAGFTLGGQMMIGLPGSTMEDELYTAKKIIEWGAREARIYPTVVFRGTPLCRMAEEGLYTPLETDDAVSRSAAVYETFLSGNVTVLRVGLQAGERVNDPQAVYAGVSHPAFGELCLSRLFRDRIDRFLLSHPVREGAALVIGCPMGRASQVAGQKRENLCYLRDRYGVGRIRVRETETLDGFTLSIITDTNVN